MSEYILENKTSLSVFPSFVQCELL